MWTWFTDLHSTRTVGFERANPISFTEMEAYGRLRGQRFTFFEIRMIQKLDEIALAHGRSKAEARDVFEVDASDGAGVAGLFRRQGVKTEKPEGA